MPAELLPVDEFGTFLRDYYSLNKPRQNFCWDMNEEIQTAFLRGTKRITVDFRAMEQFDEKNDTNLVKSILSLSGNELEAFIKKLEEELNNIDRVMILREGEEKENLKIGLKNLPMTLRISDILAEKHQGKLIQVEGIIQNIGIPFRFARKKVFICDRCTYELRKIFDINERKIPEKMWCPSCSAERTFTENKSQEIVLITQLLTLAEGVAMSSSIPISLMVVLFEDLIDNPDPDRRKFIAGAKLRVAGMLKEMKTNSPVKKLYLEVLHWDVEAEDIKFADSDIEEFKKMSTDSGLIDKLIASFSPSVYGYEDVKLGMILQIVGGITKYSVKDKKMNRGTIHILLIGEPSTSKSTLSLFNYNYVPKTKLAVCSELSLEYNEPIIFSEDGLIKIMKIGEFVENYSKKNIKIPSINPHTFKSEWKSLKGVFKHKDNRDLVKILLETGRNITITQDHSIYVADGDGIHTKKGNEIEKGDFVIIPKKIVVPHKKHKKEINLVEELLKLPTEKIKDIYLHGIPRKILKKIGRTYQTHLERGYLPLLEARKLPKNILRKATISTKHIPTFIPIDERLTTLLGYYVAEGYNREEKNHYYKIEFCFGNKDSELIKKTQQIVKNLFNLECRKQRVYQLSVNDKIITYFFKYILKVKQYAKNKEIPEIIFNSPLKSQLAFLQAYMQGDYGISASKKLISDIQYLALLMGKVITSYDTKTKPALIRGRKINSQKIHFHISRVPCQDLFQKKLNGLKKIKKIPDKLLPFIFGKTFGYENRNMRTNSKSLKNRALQNGFNMTKKEMNFFKKLEQSDIGFVKVRKTEKIFHKDKFVYDISVDDNENFIGGYGGILCHNTGAGLGVAMLKDKETESWYLSAGILPLSHKGLCILDEIDKANPEDIKSLDIVMSLQKLPVSKAGINITLPAEASVLAIANPKGARWDAYRDLKDQVNLSEVTLSRFDLKFCFKDIPNEEKDKMIAERIIDSDNVETPFTSEFLVKYLMYAKTMKPKLTEATTKKLTDFYMEMRQKTKEQSGIMVITPRQFEGMIRTSEAFAKLRLAEETNELDADNSIKCFKGFLRSFGFDYDTGQLDIDKAEGRTSGQTRKDTREMTEIFEDLRSMFGERVPLSDFTEACEKEGIQRAGEKIKQAIREGLFYQKVGEEEDKFIRKV